jgi:hypothetical protein
MKTKHKSCKSKTRSGRKCSRLASKDCEKEGVCMQHYKLSIKKSSEVQIYYTLDDGGHPFKVEIEKDNVYIYAQNLKESDNQEKNVYEEVPFVTYKAKKVFIGKDLEYKDLDGNSILLEIDSKQLNYVHIGATVFSFTAYGKIIDYVSPAENSAWPFAIDELGNCYLMVEDVILIINEELKKILQDKRNPNPYHNYFYPNNYIRKIYIGNEERYLEYTGKNFDTFKKDSTQYIPNGNNLELYFIKKDGEKEVLTKEKYNSLMEQAGIKKGFKPFLNKHVIHKRMY